MSKQTNSAAITRDMRVTMFNPKGFYGFCGNLDEDLRVFFHASVFERGRGSPLPVIGERVMVEYTPKQDSNEQAPRAIRVVRTEEPVLVTGRVTSFNPKKGWGFIKGRDGVVYYLHRSEVEAGRLPIPGQEAVFYSGYKRDRPRACYVHLGRMGDGGTPHDNEPRNPRRAPSDRQQ